MTKRTPVACDECGKGFEPRKPTSKYCSAECRVAAFADLKRKDGPWQVNPYGYIHGKIKEDGKWRTVRQHRHIMERHLGRKLLRTEDVHHVNGIKTDNRIENLQVIDHAEHARLTNNRRPAKRGPLNISDAERQRRVEAMRKLNRENRRWGGAAS